MLVTLKNARLSFPSLFTPTAFQDSKPAFSAKFIIQKGDPVIKDIEKAITEVAAQKWAGRAKVLLNQIKEKDKLCLKDGDKCYDAEGNVRDGYEGSVYVSARSKSRPGVFDRNPNNVLTEEDGRPYAGCYVNARVDIYPYEHPQGGKGITAKLIDVQFVSDGDAFGGGVAPSPDAYEDLSDTGDSTGGLV